jgi:hypothetical protein
MFRIRASAAAVLLMMSGSALADGPARLALPIPTLPGVALSEVLGGLPAMQQLLGSLGLTTGAGATNLLPGLVPVLGQALNVGLGTGAGLILGGLDPYTGDPLPGLAPAFGRVLSDLPNMGNP